MKYNACVLKMTPMYMHSKMALSDHLSIQKALAVFTTIISGIVVHARDTGWIRENPCPQRASVVYQ